MRFRYVLNIRVNAALIRLEELLNILLHDIKPLHLWTPILILDPNGNGLRKVDLTMMYGRK